jgi:hypothetical protein
MEELIRILSSKVGLTEEQSRSAVEIVVTYLKQQLPAPIAGQLDSVLGRSGPADDISRGLGDFLKKK